MKVLIRQFLGKNHSWSVVGWGLADALISMGHDLHLFSTDGVAHFPERLKPYLKGYTLENSPEVIGSVPDPVYDLQISYTSMKNFPFLLSNGSKNRFGIWCYEWDGKNVLPNGFAKNHVFCDTLCAPSKFAKDVFVNSGVPSERIKVIPHGIDVSSYQKTSTVKINTDKKYKIFSNIAQLHLRKNIPGLLDAYGKAFDQNDDVTLILKCRDKSPKYPFDVSFQQCLSGFKKKYPKHAEIKVFSEFVDDMSDLYRSIDAVYTMSHCEGFYFPGLEGLAAGKMSIAPAYGGQLDFLNNENSYLVSGSVVRANPRSMYWEEKSNAVWFQPSVEDAADKLKLSYKNYEEINKKLELQKSDIYEKYSWASVAQQIINLCQ
jgi:glycosyltransferase involved in cell wall biosynthesis